MPKLTCAIVEDDVISIKMIEGMVEKTGMLSLKASFTSPIEAMQWLIENPVELLLLDMEMPQLNGIELLRSLIYKPEVIIISGNPGFAIDAFEFSVTDYLLKPVKDYSRFLKAVNKVVSKIKTTAQSPDSDSLFVKVDSLLQKLDTNEILWVEAFGDYIKIQTGEKLYTVYSTLKKIEEKLPEKFVRVHRSYIVNISKITNIDPSNLEINKKIIPISGSYREILLNKIKVL
jgi:DNA-binding LytR/AlgR family response regulator